MKSKKFKTLVQCEIDRARSKRPPIHSMHEGYAVILEELDEFWDEVKKQTSQRDIFKAHSELVQVAAMCQRTAEDVIERLL